MDHILVLVILLHAEIAIFNNTRTLNLILSLQRLLENVLIALWRMMISNKWSILSL